MRKAIIMFLTTIFLLVSLTTLAIAGEKQYVIVFKNNQLPVNYQEIIKNAGASVVSVNSEIGSVLIKQPLDDTLTKLTNDVNVEAIGPEGIITVEKIKPALDMFIPYANQAPGSLYSDYQWDVKRVGGRPETWAIQKGHHDVIVGLIDTGIDAFHPDLQKNVVIAKSLIPGFDSAEEASKDFLGHGTLVAGNIAADGAVKGVGPGLALASYRVFGNVGETSASYVAKAIVMAVNDGVKIINISLTGYVDMSIASDRAQYQEMERAVNYALNKGVMIVAASGNEGLNLDPLGNNKILPADIPGVITVSATNQFNQLTFYANYGASLIDTTAPGGDFGSSFIPWDFATIDLTATCFGLSPEINIDGFYVPRGYTFGGVGTSLAAPKVAGILGLITAQYPLYSSQEIQRIYFASSTDIGGSKYFGTGMPDAFKAINYSPVKLVS